MSANILLLLVARLGAGTDVVDTVAGTGRAELNGFQGKALEINLDQPFGLELEAEASGDAGLYICEIGHHRVLRLDLRAGTIATVAGNGQRGLTGDGGQATAARLDEPYEVRVDRSGDLYLVEMKNAVVRKVDRRTGTISRIAGTGRSGFSGDGGQAAQAELKQPHSLALDGKGGLYIADIGNHRVRKVELATGIISTLAGTGEASLPLAGPAPGRPILGPRALWCEQATLWIALREGHSLWQLDLRSNQLAPVVGDGKAGFVDGGVREARLNGPKGLALDRQGRAYLMDTENHAVRRWDPAAGRLSTLAGGGPAARGSGGDGGPRLEARFDRPHGIAVSPAGDLVYVGDSNNHRVRRIRLER